MKKKLNGNNCCVVIGNPRSGTSIVTHFIRKLGYDFGDCRNGAQEDQNIIKMHNGNRTIAGSNAFKKKLAAYLRHRNCRELWGFKDPIIVEYLDLIFEEIENPFLISVTRDPIATINSEVREDQKSGYFSAAKESLSKYKSFRLNKIIATFSAISKLIEKDYERHLCISLESLIKSPEKELFRIYEHLPKKFISYKEFEEYCIEVLKNRDISLSDDRYESKMRLQKKSSTDS